MGIRIEMKDDQNMSKTSVYDPSQKDDSRIVMDGVKTIKVD